MEKIIVSRETKELLRKTIDEKWKLVLAGEIAESGRRDCHLCQEFLEKGCTGCPIFMKTGRILCEGTPYKKWDKHQNNIHPGKFPLEIRCATCKKIATQEIDFLEALYEECEVETK